MSRKNKHEHYSGYFEFEDVIEKMFVTDEPFVYSDTAVYIKKVVYNNPATIVFWSDGTKTISKCHGEDEYDAKIGLLLAILKKFGGSKISRILDDWGPMIVNGPVPKMHVINVSDVRRRNK